jgi:hypothetical protein
LPSGEIIADRTLSAQSVKITGKYTKGCAKPLEGYQLRYIYFINKDARKRLTVPEIPFSRIEEIGASMYKGEKIKRSKWQESEHHSDLGGSNPT